MQRRVQSSQGRRSQQSSKIGPSKVKISFKIMNNNEKHARNVMAVMIINRKSEYKTKITHYTALRAKKSRKNGPKIIFTAYSTLPEYRRFAR